MASSNPSKSKLGSHIVLAGLLLQIIIFGFFVSVALVFHLRFKRATTMTTRSSHDLSSPLVPWRKLLYILYVTSAAIMIRSIVRVAEFVEGFEGTIILHEVYLYAFDAVPMAAVMVVFNIWYPFHFSDNNNNHARKVVMVTSAVDGDCARSSLDQVDVELQE